MSVRFSLLAVCAYLLSGMIAGCGGSGDGAAPESNLSEIIQVEEVSLNPTGAAPLSALLTLETAEAVTLQLRVVGRNGSESDVVHEVAAPGTAFEVPILGLYPAFTNEVEVTLLASDGRDLGTRSYEVTTEPLPPWQPAIDIQALDERAVAAGFTLVSYWGRAVGGESRPQRPIMFDRFGDIRWYLDFADHPNLAGLHFDVGVERLHNGNLYFGDSDTDQIYEVTMLGEVVATWELPGYGFHHNVQEKPNGNFLVTANKLGEETVEDHVIEIDRESGEIVNVWDLRASLDYDRVAHSDDRRDWFHLNSVWFDERDGAIIVCGRNQGLAKLTASNDVVWILSPHEGWGTSGGGEDLRASLLRPLDAEGLPIEDQAVLDGFERHESFDWPWRPHAPSIMPNGNLLVFDNGDGRQFGEGELYSRAVEYQIDEEAMTVQQVWSYGAERGAETYAPIVSDADFLPGDRHVLFSAGAVTYEGRGYGKVIEVEYPGERVVFEAQIEAPELGRPPITFHRTERLPIYPPDE